jgi:hypothetical protein
LLLSNGQLVNSQLLLANSQRNLLRLGFDAEVERTSNPVATATDASATIVGYCQHCQHCLAKSEREAFERKAAMRQSRGLEPKVMGHQYADGPGPTGGGTSRNPSLGRAMDTPPPAVRPRGLGIAATPLGATARVDEAVRTAFETYDVDGSGTLTKDEAKHMVVAMNLEVSDHYINGVWSAFDTDGNGTLDMEEFARFFEVLVKRAVERRPEELREDFSPLQRRKQKTPV